MSDEVPDLESYDPIYAECRDILHAWSIQGYYAKNGEPFRRMKCVRCGMVKHQNMAWGGRTRYVQPDGYRLPGVARREFRDMAWKRASVYESEEDLLAQLEREATRKRRRAGGTR